MKIAFYAPLKAPDHPVPSGDRRMARLLMAALEKAGFDVELVCRFRSFDGKGDGANQEKLRREAETEADWLCDHVEADLWFTYHLYHKAPDWIGPAVSSKLGIPYWLAEASFAPKQLNGPWHQGHQAVEEAIRQADGILELNPTDHGGIAPLLKPEAKCLSVKPFLDAAPYLAAAANRTNTREQLARRLGLDSGRVWIATTAMMRPGDKLQSYQLLANSLSAIGHHDWQLLVIGDGPARGEVEKAFTETGRVAFLGLCEEGELPEILSACDLFAWPGIKEAFGLAMLEAQASGLPVISANRPGIANMILQGKTGLLSTEGDIDGFSTSLACLLSDPDRRREMAQNAVKNIKKSHDIQIVAALLKQELSR
ncbi:glycosyltransferase family 4 protein [Aestuariispira insulae]|uniref:Glycosyltransferase involved in cell wall biosynthesis n=1 Tax=Aestuariispira insulae TaxID=1461337 RepID=A0A3D9HPB6_9PROT|nr:glycosyltransferase family 4 protein [Aestuariispira insulae]RED51330.1 glycosyltransferase involved in cell wall biosynthesis [Aestuariispira insulae]